MTRQQVVVGLLTWNGILALCEQAMAARRPKVEWSRDAEGRFLVIADCQPNELVSSVLARHGGTWETAEDYLEPDYVTEVRFGQSARKVLYSVFVDRNGGDYTPAPGTDGLLVQFGAWNKRKKRWMTTANTIESALLKARVPEGMAMRIIEVGFDYGRVENAEWNVARRLIERAKVQTRVALAELKRFKQQWA